MCNIASLRSLLPSDVVLTSYVCFQLTTFMPLVHYNCSRHLRLFLCAVFAPVCSEHVAMQIPACKSLCLSVRRDCEPALTSLTLPWPHMLDCDRFPDRGKIIDIFAVCYDTIGSLINIWLTKKYIQLLIQPFYCITGNTLCVQPPDETLNDINPPIAATVQQWSGVHEQSGHKQQQHHHQCPPYFVEIPDTEMVIRSNNKHKINLTVCCKYN